MSTNEASTFYEVLARTARKMPEKVSFRRRLPDGTYSGRSFGEMLQLTDQLTAGLISVGVQIGDRITFLCDSSQNWLICDCSIVTSGGVSTPRGTDVTDEDISYIVSHSGSRFAIVQREKDRRRLESLRKNFPSLEQIFVIEQDNGDLATGPSTVGELMERGKRELERDREIVSRRLSEVDPAALATLIYTSGTTGAPKGVMLNQTGWLTGIRRVLERIGFRVNDRIVSLLPPWHAFERGVEYAIAGLGCDFLVSDIGNLREDLTRFRPTIFPSVPRIWETIYNGIHAKLKKGSASQQKIFYFFLAVGEKWARYRSILFGYDPQVLRKNFVVSFFRRFFALLVLTVLLPLKLLSLLIFRSIHQAVGGELRISVSGGSALPAVVDRFLQAIGIPVVEGYGMTETSAIISVRHLSRPTPLTVGIPIDGYKIKFKDDQNRELPVRAGTKGTLWVKSGQILLGYYKRDELNKVVFDDDGFFDTGDIMTLTWRGELMFAGRAKDTIALAGGENVEPVPIEDKLIESEFIDQVMVVGDDQKTLGALIVPNFERVRAVIKDLPENAGGWNANPEVRKLYRQEITRLISKDTGFKSFEMVPGNTFYVMPRLFDTDTEMTRTLKIKRPIVKENLAKEIAGMYK